MKNYFYLLCFFLIISCNKKEEKIEKIDPNNLKINTVAPDSLSSEQIEKIKEIHLAFAEVDKSSLEQMTNDFKRALDPSSEIEIWFQMANAYKGYLSKNKKNPDEKKEVFKLILSRSMMEPEDAIENSDLKYLSKEDAKEVMRFYTSRPKTLKVEYRK